MRIHTLTIGLALSILLGSAVHAEAGDSFPYALDPLKDSAWIVGGLAVYGGSLYLDGLRPAPDSVNLDASKVPFFDRLYTTSHSAALGTTTDILVVAFAALPAVTLPGLDARQMFTIGTMLGETYGWAYSLDGLIKSVVVRNRPYAYGSPPPPDIGSLDISSSFPSLHSTLAFASAVFAGSVFDTLHPGSPYSAAVWGGGLGVATLISTLRVVSGDHFVSDVATGAALGALVGFAVPLLHRVEAAGRAPDGSGLSLDLSPAGLVADLRLAP